MKLDNKVVKALSYVVLIIIIANFLTLVHFVYTRIQLSQVNDLLDSYNLNIFFVFVICIFAADKFKTKILRALSFAGAAASIICIVFFTMAPKII